MVSEPRKELTRAIGELYKLEAGFSPSDAKAAVVTARSVLLKIQGASLVPGSNKQRKARQKARSARIAFNAAVDACNKIDLFLEDPAWRDRRFVPAWHIMHRNLSAIEGYLIGLP